MGHAMTITNRKLIESPTEAIRGFNSALSVNNEEFQKMNY